MAEWKEYTVADVISTVIDYRGKTPKKLGGDWSDSGYRALSAKNIKTGKIVQSDSIRYVSEDMYKSWMKEEIQKEDILITSEAPFGQIYYWDSDEKIVLSQRLFAIRVNQLFYPKYIYFYMTSAFFQAELDGRATGTTVVGLRQPELLKCKIFAPEYQEQKKIADTLWCLEQKINSNEAINNNLLEQVTAKFQNMFGKYDNDKSVYRTLGTIAKFKYGTMPKKDKLGTGRHLAFSGYQVVGSYPEVMYPEPQLIIVARGVGGCGDIKYTPANCYLTNLAIAIITNCVEHDDYLYHYLRLHDTKVMNTGSAQPQITVSTLEKYEIPIPTEDELLVFSNFVKPFKELYRANVATNERLTALRDTLLPKLMSGELDVSDIDL